MRYRNIGKSAKASTENNISANTARSSCRREASTTAAEIAALIDSTDVSLFFFFFFADQSLQKEKEGEGTQHTHRSRWTGDAAYE